MNHLKAKAEIILAGTTLKAIAKEIGVSHEWVSKVVNGHSRSARVRKNIAEAIGKKVSDLWPRSGSKAA